MAPTISLQKQKNLQLICKWLFPGNSITGTSKWEGG